MTRWIVLATVFAGCGSKAVAPPAPLVMPPEAAGLVPGQSTEADVAKAWPEAEIVRDKKFGGADLAACGGQPAIYVSAGRRHDAKLVELDGAPRLVVLTVPIERTCAEVMPALAPRRELGPCWNRGASPDEHAICIRTADRTRRLEVSCYDRKAISYYVEFERGKYGI